MKIIELLTKIANDEEVPHFKVGETEYFLNWRGDLLEREEDKPSTDVQWFIDKKWLNTEVEIIEEDKPKTLKNLNTDYYRKCCCYESLTKEEITLDIQTLKNKINEIIDKINGVDKE